MPRLIFLLLLIAIACNSKTSGEEEDGDSYEQFAGSFKNATVPFQLSDTFFLKNKDTATIHGTVFSSLLPDSTISKTFGKGARVKYIPLWKLQAGREENYFIVKVQSKNKKAAFLLIFDKEGLPQASFPFLIPDNDPTTNQVSGVGKAFSISRSVFRPQANGVAAEGKDVYVYDKNLKDFVLVMTDPLDEKNLALVNPIDTLSKTHKLAGDYVKDKRNIVSVRDGRRPNLLTVFVHIEKGNCTGEIKGDAIISSPTEAIYRQTGDPCILKLNFTGSTVKLTEVEGCGSRRGQDCAFEGSFTRKKQSATKKTNSKKKTAKK